MLNLGIFGVHVECKTSKPTTWPSVDGQHAVGTHHLQKIVTHLGLDRGKILMIRYKKKKKTDIGCADQEQVQSQNHQPFCT